MKLTSDQRKIVSVIAGGGRYEKVMAVVSETIGHEVYQYVKVEKLIEIIAALAARAPRHLKRDEPATKKRKGAKP